MTRDWITAAAGPIAWFAAHVASWMLVPGAHEAGSLIGLYLVDGVALAISILAGVLAIVRLRALRRAPETDPRVQPARLLASAGLALAALSIVLVAGLALPLILIVPGAEP
jgi:hypothetical protein